MLNERSPTMPTKPKKTGILQSLIIAAIIIGALIIIVPKLLLYLLIRFISPDLNEVERRIVISDVAGSNTNHIMASNGKETFVYVDGNICKYIDDNNIVIIKEMNGEDLRHICVSDKYLVYDTYSQTYRYDIATGKEIKLLENISIDYIACIDNVFFVKTDTSELYTENKNYNYLIVYEGDDTEGVKIDVDVPDESYGENHIENIPMYKSTYKDYSIYIGYMTYNEMDVIAIEKDGVMHSFREEAIFMVDNHMVTMDLGKYKYNNQTHNIKAIQEDSMKYFACMSCLYNDDIYVVTREATGHTRFDTAPDAVEEDYLLKISPKDGREYVLYKADKETRIVGFNIEKNKIFLINKEGQIYMQDLTSGAKENITKVEDEKLTLYFKWCNDRLFIFGHNQEFWLIGSYECR